MAVPKIAVIDHSSEFLRLMNVILQTGGYEMIPCPNGSAAHLAISKGQPDLIVIDTWLQFKDEGWQVLQSLRLDPLTLDIPIILCSTDILEVSERMGELDAMRGVTFVAKPFSPEGILDAIDKMLAG